MSNEKRKEKSFVPLKETCIYRLTIECGMFAYNDVIQSMEEYATIIKKEIEVEV